MRKAIKAAVTALVCFALLFSPTFSKGMEIGTTVSVEVEAFQITSITEDFTLPVGGTEELMVSASQLVSAYQWDVSTDGGTNWVPIATTPTYTVASAQLNTPVDVPYQYRVTVTNAFSETDSAIIRLLVSNDYAYRTIELRNGDTEVSAYMHNLTRLVVTPLPDSSAQARSMEVMLADSCVPLLICEVSLLNQNDQIVPYFGKLKIDFEVGSEYDGETLRVFHRKGSTTEIYTGLVTSGILSIYVDELSPFMVEVPVANTHGITASAGSGGSILPTGKVTVKKGDSRAFTFLPDAGFAVDTVTVDGSPVTPTGNSYTISDVQADKTITVAFRMVAPASTVHTVTASAGSYGLVNPSGTVNVRHGFAQTFYFYPEDGYELDELYVDGVPVNVIGNSYTLSAVETDMTFHATFRTAQTQPPNVQMKIAASAGVNGQISPAGDISVEYGGGMYFYFIPNVGYETDKVLVDGAPAPIASGGSYHFINVLTDRTIHATFKALPKYYTITATAGANGSISPGTMQIREGGSQTFSFLPDSGFVVDTVTVDGTQLPSPGTDYTFTNVTGAHTIYVTFKKGAAPPVIYHEITVTAPAVGGTISPTGTIQVPEGGTQTISFIPDAGYVLDTVTIDGVLQTKPTGSYTFTNVTSAHTVSATFRLIAQKFTITADVSGAGGRISPEGSVVVPEGGAQTFYFIPNSGYTVSKVRVDGAVISSTAYQYTFTDVHADHTIEVSFARTATPPTGDADSKLLWTLLMIAALLLAVLCLIRLRRLTKPGSPDPSTNPSTRRDEQG